MICWKSRATLLAEPTSSGFIMVALSLAAVKRRSCCVRWLVVADLVSVAYSITGMPLKMAGDGGGPSVQCQVARVRISSCVTWAGTAGISTGVGA